MHENGDYMLAHAPIMLKFFVQALLMAPENFSLL